MNRIIGSPMVIILFATRLLFKLYKALNNNEALPDYFQDPFPVHQQDSLHIITQEFCTINKLWVALALLFEGTAHQHISPAKAK